jgi:hypothetical protein
VLAAELLHERRQHLQAPESMVHSMRHEWDLQCVLAEFSHWRRAGKHAEASVGVVLG